MAQKKKAAPKKKAAAAPKKPSAIKDKMTKSQIIASLAESSGLTKAQVNSVMDGYEVLERMKGDDRLRDIPVLVISSVQEMESVVKGIQLGAEDYLPKSFDPVFLKTRVDTCLEKKRFRCRSR